MFGQFWVPRPPWSRGTPKTCLPLKNSIFGKKISTYSTEKNVTGLLLVFLIATDFWLGKSFWKKIFRNFFVLGMKIGLKIDPKQFSNMVTPEKDDFWSLGPIKKVSLWTKIA